ncbi:MAG: Rad52/Rad22 family DNA repair protein [Cetobacterium sp.]
MDVQEQLIKKFNRNEIKWRVQACAVGADGKPWVRIVPYISSKLIQSRLDEVFGFDGWQTEYKQIGDNKVVCRLSVWSEKRQQWIHKEEGATEEKNTGFTGDGFKSAMSGALKRVAANGLGIGRYLYSYSAEYAECTLTKTSGFEGVDTKDKKYKIYWKPKNLQNNKSNLESIDKAPKVEKMEFHKIDGTDRQVYDNGAYRSLSDDEKPMNKGYLRTLIKESEKRYGENVNQIYKKLLSHSKVNSLDDLTLKVFKDLCQHKFDIEDYVKINRAI